MIPPASTPETTQALEIVEDLESAFYLYMEVADRPGVLASVAQILGAHGKRRSSQSCRRVSASGRGS